MPRSKTDPRGLTDKPLASPGLLSYRCKNSFGWTMIGATDDADAMKQAKRSDPKARSEDLQRWDGASYVPCQAKSSPQMANDLYRAAGGNALMGVFLFSQGTRITTAQADSQKPVQFCVGDRTWIQCPAGIADALDVLKAQVREIDNQGMRHSDLPEDWGVIANEAGEITHRVLGMSGINPVTYLGRDGGPAVQSNLTIEEAGISASRSRQRHRG